MNGAANKPLQSALLLILLLGLQVRGWKQANKPCAADCTTNGNCNAELGRCECRYGWGGPTCEVPVLGACRLNTSTLVAIHRLHWNVVKSCECLREINATFTFNVTLPGRDWQLLRTHEMLAQHIWHSTPCFERSGIQKNDQHSDIPDKTEPQEWYKGTWVMTPYGGYPTLEKLPSRPTLFTSIIGSKGDQYFPLKFCPGSCSWRGACIGRSEAEAACLCWRGFNGISCEDEELPTIMPVPCSGQGRLVAGWCHCNPGYWGVECSRSTAWVPDPENALEREGLAYNRTHPRVYIYELPWNVAHLTSALGYRYTLHGPLYEVEDRFWTALLHDREVLTENPHEANLFYVPASNILYGSNVDVSDDHLTIVVDYVMKSHPQFVSRHAGKDHFMFFLDDHGTCVSKAASKGVLGNMIKLVHWAPVGNNETSKLVRPGTFVRRHQAECFNPSRDVVLPPPWHPSLRQLVPGNDAETLLGFLQHASSTHGHTSGTRWARKYLAYFGGGGFLLEPYYSGGARQAFYAAYLQRGKTPEDLKVGGPGLEMAPQSEFCIIMAGEGWSSTRLSVAMLSGCIPVFIMDFVHQPFHDVLPWGRMSLRVRHEEILYMMDILRAVPTHHRAQMRRAVARHAHAFDWFAVHHNSAYNMTVAMLHTRLSHLWGFTYK